MTKHEQEMMETYWRALRKIAFLYYRNDHRFTSEHQLQRALRRIGRMHELAHDAMTKYPFLQERG